MQKKRQLLFVQGGGIGVHDEWDRKLADSGMATHLPAVANFQVNTVTARFMRWIAMGIWYGLGMSHERRMLPRHWRTA